MGWRRVRAYRRPRPSMAQPMMPMERRSEFAKAFAEMSPPPECGYKEWEKLDGYERGKTHAKQYQVLMKKLDQAATAVREFLNDSLHKGARGPQVLRQQLFDIEVYTAAKKEWDVKQREYIEAMFHRMVCQDDNDHVAKTGGCCGPNSYGQVRQCSRRATEGNFCYQHVSKAHLYRRQ